MSNIGNSTVHQSNSQRFFWTMKTQAFVLTSFSHNHRYLERNQINRGQYTKWLVLIQISVQRKAKLRRWDTKYFGGVANTSEPGKRHYGSVISWVTLSRPHPYLILSDRTFKKMFTSWNHIKKKSVTCVHNSC